LYRTILVVVVAAYVATAFIPPVRRITKKQLALSVKRGRGSLKRELDDDSSSGGLGRSSSSPASNWLNTNKSVKELPTEDSKIVLIETGAFLLVNKQTNPKGAVGAMKYGGQTYCFESNCPQCKIPMTKAKSYPPNEETNNKVPRVACDFCKSTYNMKTGEKLKAVESTGLFGGIAKSVLGSQESEALATYQLGEKNGKVMFFMDGM